MSKRSTGVTQFFKLSMILHARRKKHPSNSYIYVFDEPGVFLHPKGQKDLLAVFEELSQETQIVFATHSLFMLNQNFPERHRLIIRTAEGTLVDAKPYRANWRYAVDALGVRLTANVLFSPTILLVEGDSDPIYLYELFRCLNHLAEIDADANTLGIMSYSDLTNLRFLIQTFKSENEECRMCILGDGDKQGRAYVRDIGPLAKRFSVAVETLDSGFSIEDYCLYPELFIQAVKQTLEQSYDALDRAVPRDLDEQVRSSWNAYEASPAPRSRRDVSKAPKTDSPSSLEGVSGQTAELQTRDSDNAGKWFKDLSKSLLDGNGSSKVALARNYAFLARSMEVAEPDAKRTARARKLLTSLVDHLSLPSLRARKEITEIK